MIDIIQADRDAAAYLIGNSGLSIDVRVGKRDDHPTVQAFATHRRVSTKAHEPMLAALENWEITGPDEDNLLWLVLHGHGTTGQAMFNLGQASGIGAKVAIFLEQDRKAAIAQAKEQS